LNYALLRLALAVGSEPIGGDRAEPNAPPRGWVNIPPEPISLTPGSPLLIMEYPAGQLIKVAFNSEGVIALSPDGVRLTHRVNTRAGATGSPCFDANLNLVAIHHQQEEGSAGNPGHGEATLIEAIVRLLRERGKGGLQARAAGGFVGLDAEGNMKPPAGSPSGESGS
jgi:hypothetical protein